MAYRLQGSRCVIRWGPVGSVSGSGEGKTESDWSSDVGSACRDKRPKDKTGDKVVGAWGAVPG
jgi:hypothetical protein